MCVKLETGDVFKTLPLPHSLMAAQLSAWLQWQVWAADGHGLPRIAAPPSSTAWESRALLSRVYKPPSSCRPGPGRRGPTEHCSLNYTGGHHGTERPGVGHWRSEAGSAVDREGEEYHASWECVVCLCMLCQPTILWRTSQISCIFCSGSFATQIKISTLKSFVSKRPVTKGSQLTSGKFLHDSHRRK